MINNRTIKFRAWNNGIKCHPKSKNVPAQMLYDEKPEFLNVSVGMAGRE